MEYVAVQVGGHIRPSPRCAHVSFVHGTELIVLGGQGAGFKLRKDIEKIEMDQELVDKSDPILMHFQKQMGGMFNVFKFKQISGIRD